MNVANPNTAMLTGGQNLWGYDATVVRRYAEFMTWSQAGDPAKAMSYVKFARYDPTLRHAAFALCIWATWKRIGNPRCA